MSFKCQHYLFLLKCVFYPKNVFKTEFYTSRKNETNHTSFQPEKEHALNFTKYSFQALQGRLMCLYAHVCSVMSNSCDPMEHSLPGFSVHGIFQARTLEWVVISYSREFSPLRYQTYVSCVSCIGRQILYHQSHLGNLRQVNICNRKSVLTESLALMGITWATGVSGWMLNVV